MNTHYIALSTLNLLDIYDCKESFIIQSDAHTYLSRIDINNNFNWSSTLEKSTFWSKLRELETKHEGPIIRVINFFNIN